MKIRQFKKIENKKFVTRFLFVIIFQFKYIMYTCVNHHKRKVCFMTLFIIKFLFDMSSEVWHCYLHIKEVSLFSKCIDYCFI